MTRRDPLALEVIAALADLTGRFSAAQEAAAATHELTGAQARLLSLVVAAPRPMNRLAGAMYCEPSNVTGLVDKLERRGLVQRRPDPADRRIKLIAPTPDGVALATRVRSALDATAPIAPLTDPERRRLRDLLRKLTPEPAEA